jgi:hypothetical protein
MLPARVASAEEGTTVVVASVVVLGLKALLRGTRNTLCGALLPLPNEDAVSM